MVRYLYSARDQPFSGFLGPPGGVPGLLEMQYEILGKQMEGYWCDIGCPRAYYQCNLDALDGRLRLPREDRAPAAPGPEPERAAAEAEEVPRGERVALRCRSRARLMRELSQSLMEAGADFSDGITLREGKGKIHIAPSPRGEALFLSAEGETGSAREALLKKYRQLIGVLQNELT